MRILAAVVLACLCIALGAVQALSSIVLRAAAQPGAWPGFVPAELSARVDRLGPAAPLPPELHLVLAREALCGPHVAREQLQEAARALPREGQVRWKLPEHGPQARTESQNSLREEVRDRRGAAAQLLHVRDVAARFDRS